MVVADDDVNALLAGVVHLLHGLDAAVQGYQQLESALGSPVDALVGHAVAFVIAVGNVEVHLVREAADEGINERNGGRAVHVVVAVDEYLLLAGDGLVETFHRDVHVLHQERVVQVVEAGAEEGTRLLEAFHAAGHQKFGKHLVDADFSGKALDLRGIGGLLEHPFAFLGHRFSLRIHKDNQLFR